MTSDGIHPPIAAGRSTHGDAQSGKAAFPFSRSAACADLANWKSSSHCLPAIMCRRLPLLPRLAYPALVLLFVTMFGSCASAANGTNIWIVTDQQHPVRELAHARVIELDAPTQIEATLSLGLPTKPSEAAAEVRQRLGNPAITQQLTAAYQGVADAWRIGVTKIPAVVVDQRYVVYGDTDAAHAVARIQTYREAHP